MNRDQLHTAIRRAACMVNSSFVSKEEIDQWIQRYVVDLDRKRQEAYGADAFARQYWLAINSTGSTVSLAWPSTQAGTGPTPGIRTRYALPDNFQKLLRVHFFNGTFSVNTFLAGDAANAGAVISFANDVILSQPNQQGIAMHRIEANTQVIDTMPQQWVPGRVAYRLVHGPVHAAVANGQTNGGQPTYSWRTFTGWCIDFLPVPSTQYSVQISYVPKPEFSADDEFQEFILYSVAAECVEKEEADSSALRGKAATVLASLRSAEAEPDCAGPAMVQRVNGFNRVGRGNTRWPT